MYISKIYFTKCTKRLSYCMNAWRFEPQANHKKNKEILRVPCFFLCTKENTLALEPPSIHTIGKPFRTFCKIYF